MSCCALSLPRFRKTALEIPFPSLLTLTLPPLVGAGGFP